MKQGYVYIMTSNNHTTLYVGVTSDLVKRVYEHKNNLAEGFTKRYNLHNLVYYEVVGNIETAITREKQIKGGRRQKKLDLINSVNPQWTDLYDEICL